MSADFFFRVSVFSSYVHAILTPKILKNVACSAGGRVFLDHPARPTATSYCALKMCVSQSCVCNERVISTI